MPRDDDTLPADTATGDDIRRLQALGYAQELARRLGGFSNFALSLSIILTSCQILLQPLHSCSTMSIGTSWVFGTIAE